MSEELSSAYWDGARRGVLVVQQCETCGALRHYPRALCDLCHSFAWHPAELEGTGTVHSWTIAHHAFSPEVTADLPYALVTVDITERVRMLGRLTGAEPALGLPVHLTFQDLLPVFHPVGAR